MARFIRLCALLVCLFGAMGVVGAGALLTASASAEATPSPRNWLPIVIRTTQTPAPSPTLTSTTPTTFTLKGVKKWVYQLQGYENDKLDQITRNAFDLAVFDLARDASTGYFTRTELSALKASGKIALAYFTIGSIEDYRPELAKVETEMPDIILGRVDGWPQERYVKYWDARWWPIVKGRVDQAIAAGYDGVYLDLIFAYEDIPPAQVGFTRAELARKMVELIAKIADYARGRQAGFLIVPQNNPELYTDYDKPGNWNLYLKSIDALAVENLYYLDSGGRCTATWCAENIANSKEVLKQGKPVFSVDYTTIKANIQDVYQKADAAGFVPYVNVAGLPECYLARVWPLTLCK